MYGASFGSDDDSTATYPAATDEQQRHFDTLIEQNVRIELRDWMSARYRTAMVCQIAHHPHSREKAA